MKDYLVKTLGLALDLEKWKLPAEAPVFLQGLAEYRYCQASYGGGFVVAAPHESASLPALKRIPTQLGKYTKLPVVLVDSHLDLRQRRALVAQAIPFVTPGKQAFLPFLGFVADTSQPANPAPVKTDKLNARAQAVLVAIIANPDLDSSQGLLEMTGLSAPTISRAVEELTQRGLITRTKKGREIRFQPVPRDNTPNELLRRALPLLSTPVLSTVFVRRNTAIEALPDAGETALAQRSLLQAPPVTQKAALKIDYPLMNPQETILGEYPDPQTVELQLWAYPPLVAGCDVVDNVSLGASLAGVDERITTQLNQLFHEEELWA